MKLKEVKNLVAPSLQVLEDRAQKKLDEGWTIIGPIQYVDGGYIQQMGLQPTPSETLMIVRDNEDQVDYLVNQMIKEGYTLFGPPFAVGEQICQSMLGWDD